MSYMLLPPPALEDLLLTLLPLALVNTPHLAARPRVNGLGLSAQLLVLTKTSTPLWRGICGQPRGWCWSRLVLPEVDTDRNKDPSLRRGTCPHLGWC
jgi:hypothetical protein